MSCHATKQMPGLAQFAQAGAPAVEEMLAALPEDMRRKADIAVAGGCSVMLCLEIEPSVRTVVHLEMRDVKDKVHRIATYDFGLVPTGGVN